MRGITKALHEVIDVKEIGSSETQQLTAAASTGPMTVILSSIAAMTLNRAICDD